MGRSYLWVLAAIPLSGCGGPGIDTPTPAPAPVSPAITVAPTLDAGALSLLGENSDDRVQVGSEADKALLVFPAAKQHLDVNALPKRIPSDLFTAQGWESNDGTEGFGVISINSSRKVGAAVLRTRVDTKDDADAIVAKYKAAFQSVTPTSQTTGDLSYSFWDDGANRLMILEAPTSGGKEQLTIAIGVKTLLEPLRIDPRDAEIDARLASEGLTKSKPEPSKGP